MKIAVEVHNFAPELNAVHFLNKDGSSRGKIRLAGVTSIKEARQRLFSRNKAGRYVSVTATYNEPVYKWLDSQRSGYVNHYSDILKVTRGLAEQKQGGKLLDGSVLPPAKIQVKTIKLICD